MDFTHSIKKRIIIVFALMIAFVAIVFAAGIVATFHVVERRLTDTSLAGSLHRILAMDTVDDWRHEPEKDEFFYVQDGPGDLLMPRNLLSLPSGFQEIELQGAPFYAMVREVDGKKYVLLRNHKALQRRENLLFMTVGGGVLLSVLLALGLGWLLARRVMSPVIRLARQVRHRDQLLSFAPPLGPDYAADEVGDLARSFDDTLLKLRPALAREQLFTSDVSNELRSPLIVLASASETLLQTASLDIRCQKQVTRIARATDTMLHLVDTFLLLARDEDRHPTEANPVSLRQVADEQADIWGKQIRSKGLEFIYNPTEHSQARYSDTLLSSVMGNLLRNAWHYTDKGRITLALTEYGFVVEDTGIGIPEEKQRAMFEPFVRGDEKRGEGLGLGLSLVQRICTNQKWEVQLYSQEPNGCRFSVNLMDNNKAQ
ncbi:HAMP domain-containing sensor histidine kinase [Pseudomonas alliivorans]|uniref:histidine kinase n=3 Tax=Pseudomonas syringae group TaxID=136849 RepID=A0A1Y6JHY2_PSEVI|nr:MULTISPECIES: HAMP domain-containing sensor histidine kinase [Pseudomonas]KTC12452.1 histidine kinase [Pseudomonas marginalis ICMP 11289]MEE4888033.1 HAMP domain-containing sensor histidine kinase [Pseudomonas alliivorans]VVO13704.1 Adaptive-response sensory-kinase SasA [Pseudomonas fluorescens]MBV1807097.1 HAMP domain-containing histidine kinase [Pseudomonas viridiflava]MCF8977085.1 HAMP domain-containing protein [Pseudomonas syringae]